MPSSIVVDHVSLDFPIYHGDARSLKKLALSAAGRFARDKQQRVVVQALRDISLKIESGERLALIGRNGAGKTTLLRCLAGIYEPVSGDVTVQGELSALLDVGLGMSADMTGRENILLRGRYLGMDGEQIGRMEEDIVGFAELGEFLDLPVKFYSSGMMLRLAFAMATSSQPNILLMDEWLLAGDAGFLEKAHARIDTFVSGADIVVISTHSEGIIRKWATRVLYLDQGRIKHDGDPDEVLAHYHGDVGAPVETVPV